MRSMLLGLAAPVAALAFPAAPAQAQIFADRVAAAPGASVQGHFDHDDGDGTGDDGHKHRRPRTTVVIGGFEDRDYWALYNNRSWEPDSFNDWWHDRPDRAYPRWIRSNQNCDRMWWGGGAWRCGW